MIAEITLAILLYKMKWVHLTIAVICLARSYMTVGSNMLFGVFLFLVSSVKDNEKKLLQASQLGVRLHLAYAVFYLVQSLHCLWMNFMVYPPKLYLN